MIGLSLSLTDHPGARSPPTDFCQHSSASRSIRELLRITQAKYIVSADVMIDQDAGDIVAGKNGNLGTHFHSYLTAGTCMDNYNFVSYKIVLYTIPYSTNTAHLLSR